MATQLSPEDEILTNLKVEQPDNTIKEKLNQHLKLKRRNHFESVELNLQNNNSHKDLSSCTPSLSAAAGLPSEIKTGKKSKMVSNKKFKQQVKPTSCGSSSGMMINPPPADWEAQNTCGGETIDKEDGPIPEKKPKSPDILTIVLNEKKLKLMQDPEILKFIEKLTHLKN